MVIFLVRHAMTAQTGVRLSGWTPGLHLSDEGRRQVSDLVERLRPVSLAAVYSSPLERTIETARPVAASKGLRVRAREALGEVRYGELEGKLLRALARTPLWAALRARPSGVRFPGGETLREAQARAVDAVEEIVAAHRHEAVAAVAHADVIRLLVAHYSGIHLDLYQRLTISPASVSAFTLGDGAPRVLTINSTGDLSRFAPVPRQSPTLPRQSLPPRRQPPPPRRKPPRAQPRKGSR